MSELWFVVGNPCPIDIVHYVQFSFIGIMYIMSLAVGNSPGGGQALPQFPNQGIPKLPGARADFGAVAPLRKAMKHLQGFFRSPMAELALISVQ